MDPDPLRPTERFSDRAEDYARFRPSYPAEAIDCILDGLGRPESLAAADAGAGTGISARLLADRRVRVHAIEPNAAMRQAARPHPGIDWRDGTAERTGLRDGSVDLVLCAQSFHWFAPRAALAEFVRVLRPGGRVALMWNQHDRTDAATDGYAQVLKDARMDRPTETRTDPHALDGARGLRQLAPRVFHFAQWLDADGLVGRALSASYMPKSGADHDRAVSGLRALHARNADADGRIRLAYRTLVLRADAP